MERYTQDAEALNNSATEESKVISRRQWINRISIPAVGAVGASIIGVSGSASALSKNNLTDEKTYGAHTYNIRNFGAAGDGKTLDTAAVQKAIDTCSLEKGGTVLVPAGDFIIGTVELKSNVTLHLSINGRLLGSSRAEDYSAGKGVPSGNGNIVMLYAANANNISIEGRGTIDGNGAAFYTGQGDNTGPNSTGGGYFARPHLLIFYKCYNLLLRDSFYTKSAYHCFRILNCEQVNIDGVRIYNRVNKNNDGFHFNSCKYVHITNCDIRCQDDACALFGSNQFVTVTNCSFSTRWSIFRFGSGEAQNIAVSNCLIYDTYGCPVKISSSRARIENLTFSNIIMKNVTGPIGIGFSGQASRMPGTTNPSSAPEIAPAERYFVRNISFNGIRASVVSAPVNHPDIPFDVKVYPGENHSCITLNALGDNYLENISFTDVHVSYAGGGSKELAAKRDIHQSAQEYFTVWDPEPSGPPAYGLYARNVKGLTLQNVRFEYEKTEARPAIIFDKVRDCAITGLSVQGGTEAESVLRFSACADILLTASRVLSPCPVFLKLEGADNQGIVIDGGDLRKTAKPLDFGPDSPKSGVRLRI